jgi:hypothetical protein
VKKEQIILDSYLHGYQKFNVFYILIICSFGSINFLLNPTSYLDLLIGLILLIFTYILIVAFLGKKALYINGNKFYRGIAIYDKILLKERIDISKYSEFNYVKKGKTDLPRIFKYSSLATFSNYHECSVYLTKSNSTKGKKIISMSDFEMYYEVRRFLQRWTELTEKNPDESNSG